MKKERNIEALVEATDFPHLRHKEGKWMATGAAPIFEGGASFRRLCFYGNKMRELGMEDIDIQCLLSDLYWDSYTECKLNSTFDKPMD